MELEHLVEKITREVIDSMKKPAVAGQTQTCPPVQHTGNHNPPTGGTVLLLAGSPLVGDEQIKNALSMLRQNGLKVDTLGISGNSAGNYEGVKTIRCSSVNDCAAALRNTATVAILLLDTGTVSKLANLLGDRFDIETVIAAIEQGKEVIGIRAKNNMPGTLAAKVDEFFRDIKSYGVKLIETTHIFPQQKTTPVTHSPSVCSAAGENECAGCGLCINNNANSVQNIVDHGAERVSAAPGVAIVPADLAGMIDHTLLKPDVTRDQVITLCQEARQYKFASCCVNPTWVATVAECLRGSGVKTCVVVGFPLGANSSVIKSMETRDAVAAGADEIDMVINVGALKAGDLDLVKRDIEAVVNAAQGRIVKVILETALLTDEEKITACKLSKEAGADFVKTSTGFGPGGATAKDIALMRQTVGKYMGVKASGGIRDFPTAHEMIKAGATRIGASASVGIVKGATASGTGY